MKHVTVIGSGFSGLTLAFYLREKGAAVTVIEKGPGLIQTFQTADGLIETAANGMLHDENVSQLFQKLEIEYAPLNPLRRKRFIFWDKPRKWPLTFSATLKVLKLVWRMKTGKAKPHPGETIADWAKRNAGEEFLNRMLAPALQGVYAGDANKLSATLVLASLFSGKKGPTVSPKGGMGELLAKLRAHLQAKDVQFKSATDTTPKQPAADALPLVIATSAVDAADLLEPFDPESAATLKQVEMLPLVSVARFYDRDVRDPQGFGCLFPTQQKFTALGVLFNDCIFTNRSSKRSETWILGGALNKSVAGLSDDELLKKIDEDRLRLTGHEAKAVATRITRWPKALPHVTVEWENALKTLNVKPPLYLHGNYLGVLGLSGILKRSKTLAGEILNG